MATESHSPDPQPDKSYTLMDLPTELHLHIATYLPYPDALALKHSCRHFYPLVYTGVHLKVNWLVERFERKLECPMDKCSFRTDESFCNARVRRIMERRRRHLECLRSPGGCFVIDGETCQKDLVPTWLKKRGRLQRARSWGYEVFMTGLVFLVLNLLWHLCGRYVGSDLVLQLVYGTDGLG
ncbi:uncharacterized protein BO95DRAFT_454620 [Aspergillus brunneoviolaceus CBS 621.78]|uniref:Uncharacterized protein n=1 Tax=Aspergillus brunneoviolaceus CBS 621.78 TaxID=1450534 RepID=A0ACD1G3U8_9EURO|nr:hypothetical protein BO95DRAFT_454620 [Aspergillus brunneoviolaceus CBS 621.78]RAH43883.1 hypothetical protein BO95DRAFT_454620 [Aspergillus brunneoviolaceus CBS 621.78]